MTEAKDVTYTWSDGWQGIVTVENVHQAIQVVADMADDPERAHVAEDDLYRHVLQEIADGRPADPSGFAAAALLAAELEFSRWYA